MKFCKAEVGDKANVKRTDGRLHEATIAELGLGDDEDLLRFEWKENGVTKSKNMDLLVFLFLNPDFVKIDDETVFLDESSSSKEPQPTATSPGASSSVVDEENVEEHHESQLESGSGPEVKENPQPKKVIARKVIFHSPSLTESFFCKFQATPKQSASSKAEPATPIRSSTRKAFHLASQKISSTPQPGTAKVTPKQVKATKMNRSKAPQP